MECGSEAAERFARGPLGKLGVTLSWKMTAETGGLADLFRRSRHPCD
jgi:hypothetical protein